MIRKIAMFAVAFAMVFSAQQVFAGEGCCGTEKKNVVKEDAAKDTELTSQKPGSVKECKELIAQKEAELENEADEAKKELIQKEINELKEMLKNMEMFDKSNKEENKQE